ncbi:MAG: adenosylcobalamin-dependent ribonucleoside-diphosphate reductase [Planctomycetota bacterium]|nr:MAG: adenosylcobalamin-dependent ribonucleoside-diphosphate reductase [Planctomycetota bacterium]
MSAQESAGSRPPFEPSCRAIQRRLIADRYQRDAPSVGAWLWRVAGNVALAEALYTDGLGALEQRLAGLEGVRVERTETAAGPAAAVLTLGRPGDCGADPDRERERFDAFLARLAALAERGKGREAVGRWRERFYTRMARWELLPNSPALMNAGRALQQLSACFVLPIPDHLEGVCYALRAAALIHKSGGGTGFSFGRLRPAGDPVRTTAGVAAGPVRLLGLFDALTDVIKQGGTRRGANMGILPDTHPDLEAFIEAKREPGLLENFNLSVGASDAFIEAVRRGGPWELRHPRSGAVRRRVEARALFDAIAQAAWAGGDPGLVFLDRLNEPGSNPTPALGRIESTNPCGEVGMLPYEPCTLASLNLAAFCEGEVGAGRLDEPRLLEAVADGVRLLEDMIEVNRYPLPEIERMAKGNRRIGLGVMGWAEALIHLGLGYDSDEAVAYAERLMERIEHAALAASEALARERGVFPHWPGSVYDPEAPVFAGRALRPRHCARTTIAPTGTIALAAGLHGGGIEPLFDLVYERRTAAALEALGRGEPPPEGEVYREVNPHALALVRARLGEAQARAFEQRLLAGAEPPWGLPDELARLLVTAHRIPWRRHVQMQAAFQAHTDNAVSKTINLPHEASVEDVRQAYLLAHELRCKGVTIYRDRSRPLQVLTRGGCDAEAGERCPL